MTRLRAVSPGLLLGLMLCACKDEPSPPPDACLAGPGRLEPRAALAAWPGHPGGGGFIPAADFDGNGTVDLMSAEAKRISFTSGRGDGTFAIPRYMAVEGLLTHLSAADLDGDGDLDLVGSDDSAWLLRVLTNEGRARFTQTAVLGLEGGVQTVHLADVDGDGRTDALSTQDRPGLLTVWRTAGAGTFSLRVDIPTRPSPHASGAADLNGDGHPELVVANASGASVEVLDVQGFSGAPISRKEVHIGSCWPIHMTVANLDRDADTDVALSCGGGLVVLLNDGQGNLAIARRYTPPGANTGVAVTDFDEDGTPDLVLDNSAHGPVLFKGAGDGSFVQGAAVASRSGSGGGMAVVDMDGDGHLDIIARTASSEGNVAIFRGDGQGGFLGPWAQLRNTGLSSHGAQGVQQQTRTVEVDVDGDGVMDVLRFRGQWLDVLRGLADGGQAPPVVLYAPGFENAAPMDMDGDCLPELVHQSPHGVAVLKLSTR